MNTREEWLGSALVIVRAYIRDHNATGTRNHPGVCVRSGIPGMYGGQNRAAIQTNGACIMLAILSALLFLAMLPFMVAGALHVLATIICFARSIVS